MSELDRIIDEVGRAEEGPPTTTHRYTINMGPQHPSTHGVLRLILDLDGENIVKCDADIGYLHRGTEKIAEGLEYLQITPYTDRMDYVAAALNNLCHVEAVEKLMQMEIPRRAQYVRVIFSELQRIASHLVWLGTHAMDIGAQTILMYCFRDREKIFEIFEEFCGARMTLNIMRIGGFYEDMTSACDTMIRDFCRQFASLVDDYENILTENRIWKRRTQGVGAISAKDAINIGMVGPCLRGSGVDWDIRKAEPYEVYEELDFIVPTGTNGDTYDRYLVRVQEMRQSLRIIQQAMDGLPEGPVLSPSIRRPGTKVRPPAGEVYHCIEGAKGEMGVYIVSRGEPVPYRWKAKTPSFVNLQSLRHLVKGHLVADVVAIIGTLDIVLGDVDR